MTTRPYLLISPASLRFLVRQDGPPPTPLHLRVAPVCLSFSWQATADRSWLRSQRESDTLRVEVDPAGLPIGVYSGTVTVSAVRRPEVLPVAVAVRLTVAAEIFPVYLPLVQR